MSLNGFDPFLEDLTIKVFTGENRQCFEKKKKKLMIISEQ